MTEISGGVIRRPWRLPGGFRYGLARLRGALRPPVTLFAPDPGRILIERDVPVAMRDGTVLRVNVHRPADGRTCPVLMSAHPYGKDDTPSDHRRPRMPVQYRMMRQAGPIRHSTLTGWEAPDPAWWVDQGYAVINADVRGAGHSEGVCEPFSAQEGQDYAELVEWAAAQPWSTGAVGLVGVSYLAISQYRPAALRPPHLKAICPWEGMTDPYRDLMRPGGLLEDGFMRVWNAGLRRRTRPAEDLVAQQHRHPLRDTWWEAHTPELSQIEVPMLVCTSFSDNNLHSRGSFRAVESAGSADLFAYTHRDGKWSVFYSEPAKRIQLAFFDKYLRGADVPPPPRVRLEVRDRADHVVDVRDEQEWPLARTQWQPLHLGAGGRLTRDEPGSPGRASFATRRDGAAFVFTADEDMELSGPMAVRLWVQVHDRDDVDLVVGVEKWCGRRYVGFEGSYGWGRDRIATGWQKASLRELDKAQCAPGRPVHTYARREPLTGDQVVPVEVALGPSATLFHTGESLRLVVAGRWLSTRSPFTGQFPAHYAPGPAAHCTLHWGPDRPACLVVPHIP